MEKPQLTFQAEIIQRFLGTGRDYEQFVEEYKSHTHGWGGRRLEASKLDYEILNEYVGGKSQTRIAKERNMPYAKVNAAVKRAAIDKAFND